MALRQTDGKYMTRNMTLAAYLELNGYNCEVCPIPGQEKRVEFWIEIDDALEALVDKFYQRQGAVEPREFGFVLKSVKDKMFEARR